MTIQELLTIEDEKRDFSWEENFFKIFSESNVKILNESAITGPDNWPYLMVETIDDKNITEQLTEPSQKVLRWLSERGIGLVINPHKPYPDYVFTYGMIWGFRETGYFVRPTASVSNPSPATFDIKKDQKIIAGAPTEKYFPVYARKILKNFFLDQGILNPKILVVSVDGKHFDLMFSLESLKNPPQNEHLGIAEALSWFFPPDYSIVLISEKNLPQFVEL